jgi:hypothetical protein
VHSRRSPTPHWHGTPIPLGELFILKKNRREARALLFSHVFGWEVRIVVGTQLEVAQTYVCRSQDEVSRHRRDMEGRDDREGLGVRSIDAPPPVLRDCLKWGLRNGMKLQNVTATSSAAIPLFYVCERCGSQFTVPPFPFRRSRDAS